MPWSAAAYVGAAAIGYIASSNASDSAEESANRTNDISREQLQFGKEQYADYKENVWPLLQKLAEDAKTGVADRTELRETEAGTATKDAYASARTALDRRLLGSRNPADPGYAALHAPLYMDEAAHVARNVSDAREGERQRVESENWNRKLQAIQGWQGIQNAATSNINAAGATSARAGALSLQNAQLQSQNAGQLAYAGGYAARRWGQPTAIRPSSSSPGGEDPYNVTGSSGVGAGAGTGAGGYGADWLPAGDYGGGWKDGGAIRTRARGGSSSDGGPIKGPGSGTSDSVRGRAAPGSYILSADTVRAIGVNKLNKMAEQAGVRPGMGGDDGDGVPVRLSNGEYQVPPSVVKFHGEEHFHKLQQRYHRPVADDASGMANGGAIRPRGLPRGVEDAIFRSLPSKAISRSRRQ
jgi:hypothetical protein